MNRTMEHGTRLLLAVLLAGGAWAACPQTARAAPPPAAAAPEQTVTRYLTALKDGNFRAACKEISKAMAQGKSCAAWAKEQQWTMQMSDAKIFDFHVYPGKVNGHTAQVPDILSSQDKFLNQLGVPEYELYTLVREGGAWKIDRQQLLERDEQAAWFPPQVREK